MIQTIKQPLSVLLLFGVALLCLQFGCSSSSSTPNAGKNSSKGTEKEPTQTVPAETGAADSKSTADNAKSDAAATALEKSGAKLTRRDGQVVRVDLGPSGNDTDLALLKDLPAVERLTAN